MITVDRKKGGLTKEAGKIGKVIEDIAFSEKNVEFMVTDKLKVKDANGDTVDLKAFGGAKTTIWKNRIQIFVNVNAASISSGTAKSEGAVGSDGKLLKFTNSLVDAHELGHAWGAIVDKITERSEKLYAIQLWAKYNLAQENKRRSLEVENWQRARLGMARRTSHP